MILPTAVTFFEYLCRHMENRRQHTRHKVFRFEVKVASRETFRASYLRDLSEGGLFVRSQKPMPMGAQVAIELSPPDGGPLKLTGTVVRIEPPDAEQKGGGFGVKFDDLDAATTDALHAALRAYEEPPVDQAPTAEDVFLLRTQLADAHGAIEAYEETIALLRESEMEAVSKLEAAELDRATLARVAAELDLRALELEHERTRLHESLAGMQAQLEAMEEEAERLRHQSSSFDEEMIAAREMMQNTRAEHDVERDQAVAQVREKAKREQEASVAQRARLESELLELRQQLSAEGLHDMRSELRRLTGELDDEKLKSMSLEKALERFKNMGGRA